MTELKPTVSLTSVNSENMSRHQMLEWVNTMANGQYKKIEELCSGVAYCQMMEMIFPNCINAKRIKMSAKLEHEYFHNMKLFQGALNRLKLDKTIPVDRLIKGRFQDNFEFLQWFKKFFDSQVPGLENIKAAANEMQAKPIKGRNPVRVQPEDELEELKNELTVKITNAFESRDEAYEKLRKIEVLLTDNLNNECHVEFCKRVLDVLYKTEPDESVETVNEDSLEAADNE